MKSMSAILLVAVFLPLVSYADDFSLSDGREFKGVTVSRIEEDGVVVITDEGVEKLPFALLPKEAKDTYRYVPKATPSPQPVAAPATTPAPSGTDAAQSQPSPAADAKAVNTPRPSSASQAVASMESAMKQRGIHPFLYLEVFIRAALGLIVALATLGCAWFIVKRLLDGWILQQKGREFDSANTKQFHAAYADFFAVLKLWNHCVEHNEDELPSAGEYELPHATRWELLTRAYVAESTLEAIFLKLSTTWNLSPVEIELLGRFRQAFRTLGEAIKNNKPLKWNNPEQGEYLIFNRLASGVALLVGSGNATAKNSDLHANAFKQITSSHWESVWNLTDAEAQAKGLPVK